MSARPSATSSSACGSASTSTASSTPTTARRSCRSRSTPRSRRPRRSSRPTRTRCSRRAPRRLAADQVRGCATYARVLAGEQHLLQRRGRGLLRRPAASARRGRLRAPRTPSSTSCCPAATGARCSSGGRRGATRHLVQGDLAVPVLAGPAAGAARPHRRAARPAGRARTSSSSRSRTSRGGRSTTTSATCRSRVVLNVDVPTTGLDLVHLAAHEVYPGHHTEHAVKEQLLMRDRGAIEEGIQLVPTPQAVLSEGIAETGGDLLLDDAAQGGGVRDPAPARHRARRPRAVGAHLRVSASSSAPSVSTRR